jgi:folate-binding protein YgfZ
MSQHSILIPVGSAAAYEHGRRHAALVDRSGRGRIVVSGADRASYLQGLFTNDIASLPAGQGCYSAYLTAQGRMIADMHVYELGDLMLMTLPRAVKDTVLARLDQFVFTEDVKLGDVTDTYAQIGVIGPDAASRVASALHGASDATLAAMSEHANCRANYSGVPVIVTRTTDAGEPGFDVYVDAAAASAFNAQITGAGVPLLDEAAAEAIRIESGIPLFGRDMNEETIPLEAGIESRAISFTKGCYVGQEVIVRVLHRGHGRVARRLVGIRLDGDRLPPAAAEVHAADREVGSITSSVWSPALRRPIALGYLHRDFVTPGTAVVADGVAGEVVALPFVTRT